MRWLAELFDTFVAWVLRVTDPYEPKWWDRKAPAPPPRATVEDILAWREYERTHGEPESFVHERRWES